MKIAKTICEQIWRSDCINCLIDLPCKYSKESILSMMHFVRRFITPALI